MVRISRWQFSIRCLLALPVAIASWILIHSLNDYLMILTLESVILLAYSSALLSVACFGNLRQRGFALGALIAPAAFCLLVLCYGPYGSPTFAIIEGEYFGPLIFNMLSTGRWVILWLPVSLGLGCVSLLTQKMLVSDGSFHTIKDC